MLSCSPSPPCLARIPARTAVAACPSPPRRRRPEQGDRIGHLFSPTKAMALRAAAARLASSSLRRRHSHSHLLPAALLSPAATAGPTAFLHSHATSFGYKQVREDEKSKLVGNVFSSVASSYDVMNDLMSIGLHRLWKDRLISKLNPFPGMKHLDVAGGTGDVAFRVVERIKSVSHRATQGTLTDIEEDTHIYVCDINPNMLDVGKKRAAEKGYNEEHCLSWVQGDAEALSFEDGSMDGYTIAFGIRNVTHIEKALSEAYRVLKKGGRFLCLDEKMEQTPGDQAEGVVVVADTNDQEEEERKKTMVLLLCDDDVVLVVPKEEARRYGRTIERKIKHDRYSNPAYTQNISIGNRGYSMIDLPVESNILSKIIQYYSNKKHDDTVEFIGGLDHPTLFDLILAASNLENQGLLEVACSVVSNRIAGKSSTQIRAMFGIRPPPAAGRSTQRQTVKKIITLDSAARSEELDLEERALRALHLVRCQDFTAYDPKRRAFLHSRFSEYNIAFFDLDEESRFGRGLPLHCIDESSIVSSSVNFISLKVRESDVGFPINVFGTIIARDFIDYRCVSIFKRDADDSQVITSPDDTLTLLDPHRGLVPQDIIYFEINLKIKCEGGATKDFSRGLTDFNICRVRYQTTTTTLISWLSRVELETALVRCPLEASITIDILEGPCDLTRVAAWTSGNTNARIILYRSEAAAGIQMTNSGYSVVLARRVVLVPLGEKLVLHLVGKDEAEDLILTLGHCNDEDNHICKMGYSELQVKVSWTAIPKRKIDDWKEVVGDIWLLK